MPTYEYTCPEGHHFERVQKISDKARAKCPICGRPATRQISGGAGLVFKGSGFYITDYGKDGKGPRKAETAEAGSSEKGEKPAKREKPEGKDDAKPETKTTGTTEKAAGKKAPE